MNNSGRGVAFGLAVVLIVLVGLAVALTLAPSSPSASLEPSPTLSAAATTPPPSESPSSLASPSPGEPSASASPSSPEPSASDGTGVTATIRGLKLDGANDPAGHDRRISFRTGPAEVSMRLTVSPPSAVDACLEVNAVQLYCTSGHAFTMTGQTSRSNATWTLTLRGQGAETPKLDVTFDFPAAEPTLTIDGAWFDGAARPDYNGVVVEISPRGPAASISATWEGSQSYRLTITEQPSADVLKFEGTGSTVSEGVLLGKFALNRIELLNTGAGASHIPLVATIAWH
jgi:hypothetical protein